MPQTHEHNGAVASRTSAVPNQTASATTSYLEHGNVLLGLRPDPDNTHGLQASITRVERMPSV